MKKLKPVPKNKKKSLGKLPPKVRNKMGFMKINFGINLLTKSLEKDVSVLTNKDLLKHLFYVVTAEKY